MSNRIEISKDIASEILSDDSEEFILIQQKEVGSQRWANNYEAIAKCKDGKFYKFYFSCGTGDEGERPFEYVKSVTLTEVFPKQVIITVYE